MASQQRINAYMERHRLGPLFEDLMNKVLRDMPEEPMIYLLRTMYKKAGMEIPQGIRHGGVRKSTSDLPRNASPERASRPAAAHTGDVGASRDYDRPWATSPTRRMKPKKSDGVNVSKSRPDWNPDNKTKALDDFWEDSDSKKDKTAALRKSASKKSGGVVNAWATVGMGGEDEMYTSPPHQGRSRGQGHSRLSEADLLASETVALSQRSEPQTPGTALTASASRYSRGPREEARRQRARMSEMLTQSEQRSDDSGVDMPKYGHAEDDDAVELLEDADDLRREGVTNIPKSGYKLSKAMRYRKNEPRVRLNINVGARPSPTDLWRDPDEPNSAFHSERSSPDQREFDDDEEFESVSQVTGPRQPVWKMPESEVDPLSPYYSSKAPQPSSHKQKRYSEKKVSATTPDHYFDRSVDSTEDLTTAAKSWTGDTANRVSFEAPEEPTSPQSVRSASTAGGWRLPDDSDVASIHDWNKRVKGGPSMDPKAY